MRKKKLNNILKDAEDLANDIQIYMDQYKEIENPILEKQILDIYRGLKKDLPTIIHSYESIAKQKKQNVLAKPYSFNVGEIVYTKSSKVILDIGLVESVKPLKIIAKSSTYSVWPRYYGAPEECHWHSTGFFITVDNWKKISNDTSTEEICRKIDVPYYQEKV